MSGLNDHVSTTEKALASTLADLAALTVERDEFRAAARMYAADLGELRYTLAALAADADAKLSDEYADRQLIAEHLVDRLTVLSGGGK
jgi:uncharacterized protein (DUF924 family)